MLQNNKFNGEINGITYKDFKLHKNNENIYLIEEAKDRIGVVNCKIGEMDNFLSEYFSSSIALKFSPGASGYLSSDNLICKEVEKWADYILASKDIREERKRKKNKSDNYRFFIDKTEFKNLTQREGCLDAIVNFTNNKNVNLNKYNENEDKIINYLIKTSKGNYKKSKKITQKDYKLNKGDYAAEVLNKYQSAVEKIDCIIRVIDGTKNIKEDKKLQWVKRIKKQFSYVGSGSIEEIEDYILLRYKGRRQILLKIKATLKNDMEYCVLHLRGVFGENPKNLLKDSTCPDWDKFNWHNPKHVKELLFLRHDFDPGDDISYLVLDLEIIIKKIVKDNKFTKVEIFTLNLIQKGYKVQEIKNKLNLSQPRISAIVKNIVKKITNFTFNNFRVD